MYDLIIKNARIIDGTGAPWRRGDVAVKDGVICGIGKFSEAKEILDAEDKYLAPGFIDIHSHSDGTILKYPTAESRIFQGVTTEVGGNCGDSMAPLGEGTVDPEGKFETVAEYLDAVEKIRPSVNIATLVGHGTLRDAVMGYSPEKATDEQIEKMKELAAKAMEDGAVGISTGLIYPPGSYSDTEELSKVVSAVAPYDGYYATHMRNENRKLAESVKEAITVAENAGVRLQISHHKCTYKADWQIAVKTTVAMIEKARRNGLDVCCDQYPYNASATSLSSNVPSHAFAGGVEAMLARLRDPETRASLRDQSNANHVGRWGDIHVSYLYTPENQWMIGKSILEIAEALGGKDPADTCFDIVLAENNHVGEVNFGMCEEDIEYIMSQDFCMPGSDGEAYTMDVPGKPHPRNFATFVRVLAHYCRDRKLFPIEKAIQKMTSLPASRLGFSDRGTIKEGCRADLVLFDLDALEDKPDYADPQQICGGIEKVYVNGVLTADKGVHTGARAGMVLRKGKTEVK